MTKWVVSFQGFQLAADACGMFSYVSSQAHLRICLQIACAYTLLVCGLCTFVVLLCNLGRASAEVRRHQLAQLYDEMARREWSEKAARGQLAPRRKSRCAAVLSFPLSLQVMRTSMRRQHVERKTRSSSRVPGQPIQASARLHWRPNLWRRNQPAFSQHSCGMLLHTVAEATWHISWCPRWLAVDKPSFLTAKLWHALACGC